MASHPPDLKACYALLEVRQGADWRTVRQAYKTQVQFFHPDRYTHDPELQAKATAKLKQLNTAYTRLKAFYESGTPASLSSGLPHPSTNAPPNRQEVTRAYQACQAAQRPSRTSASPATHPPKKTWKKGIKRKIGLTVGMLVFLAVGLYLAREPQPLLEETLIPVQGEPILWRDVLADARFQQLGAADQKAVKRHWFRTYPLRTPYVQNLSVTERQALEMGFVDFDQWHNVPFIE